MLINVEKMRMLKTRDPEVRFRLIRQNLERFFRDYIYYYNVYDRDELIIDSGYLPYHYLDEIVLQKVIDLLENELGYAIIIMKTTNTNKLGYIYGDLINIRLFDVKSSNSKDIDDYFNLKMFQPLYSSLHNYSNITGNLGPDTSYKSCLDVQNEKFMLQEKNI
jgi:hypothetical protein